jgi:hypothetical protein
MFAGKKKSTVSSPEDLQKAKRKEALEQITTDLQSIWNQVYKDRNGNVDLGLYDLSRQVNTPDDMNDFINELLSRVNENGQRRKRILNLMRTTVNLHEVFGILGKLRYPGGHVDPRYVESDSDEDYGYCGGRD